MILSITCLVISCGVPKFNSELKQLYDQADTLYQSGKYEQAIPIARRALDITEHTLGPEHADMAMSLNMLAVLYTSMGQYEQALPLNQRALAIREKALGPEHRNTATSLNNLAVLYTSMGQYEQALPLNQRALVIFEKALGPEHRNTAQSLNNLAELYSMMGEYDQALSLNLRALAIREKALGPEHRNTAQSLNNLGGHYELMGQYGQALPYIQRALAINEKALGPEHPDTAQNLNNLAELYVSMGQYGEALPYHQRALAINEKVLGPEHPNTALSLNNLARLYGFTGQYRQALPYHQRALAINEKVLDPEHPNTALSLNNLAGLYVSMGQYEQALPFYQRALAIWEKVLGPEHPNTALSLNNLAGLYVSMGQYEQALPLYHQAFNIALHADAPVLRTHVARNLGYLHRQRNQAAALSIFYYKLSVNAAQQLRGGAKALAPELQRSLTEKWDHPYRELVELLIAEGRLAQAEQVLAMFKEHELFEFVRGDATSDPRTTQVTLSPTEQALADKLHKNAQGLAVIYKESEALHRRSVLSDEERYRGTQLREQLTLESERFDKLLKEVEQLLAEQGREQDKPQTDLARGALSEVLAALQERTGTRPAVLYFLPSDNATTFLVVTPDGAFSEHGGIGEKAIRELIGKLRETIKQRDESYLATAAELYTALIQPVEALLKTVNADTLMLYLVDALRYLPFAVLYDNATNQHLVDKYSLAVYTAAAQVNLKDPVTKKWSAVGFGVSLAIPGFDPLPAVAEELRHVVRQAQDPPPAGILPGQRYLDKDFSRERLLGLLDGRFRYAVAHVATHFRLVPESEDQSVLLLGNGERLTLKEISTDQGIKLRGFDLITLSACETALSSGAKGEEVESLGAILQQKGAKAVLATLWKVQDAGTSALMQAFYSARGEDQKTNKAQALRDAQRALLHGTVQAENPNIDLAHPYYWAPVVLMGNWQ